VTNLQRGVVVRPPDLHSVGEIIAVTTSAIASIAELSGSRAFLTLGSGDSAVRSLGLPVATLAKMAEPLTAVKSLLANGQAEAVGRQIPASACSHALRGDLTITGTGDVGGGIRRWGEEVTTRFAGERKAG
jgi:hypothetical protein